MQPVIKLYPMITLSQLPGRTTRINGSDYLFFSGYSYLGLGALPEFQEWVSEGIRHYGVVYPSSRVSNTPLELYERLETALARFTGTEAAATFSSGFLSARTAVEVAAQYLPVYALPQTHPASTGLPGVTVIHDRWETFLEQRLQAGETQFALAADSIHPTPGVINDFGFLQQVPPECRILLLLDDSHGIGWMGAAGQGAAEQLRLPAHVELLHHFSLSKAFHLNGGAICGSREWIGRIRQHVNYATSTPLMPALAHAWLESEALRNEQRRLLLRNIAHLQKLSATTTFVRNGGTPVFVVDIQGIAAQLLDRHIIISSFSYPDPQHAAVNRVVINALHTLADLETLVAVLHEQQNQP